MKPKVNNGHCFLKLKGEKCIRLTAPDPNSIECERCLWNLTNTNEKTIDRMERLFKKYRNS